MASRYRSDFSQVLRGRWSYNHTPACGSPRLCQLRVSFPLIGEGRYHCIVTTWPLFHTDLANAGNHMGEKFKFLSESIKKNLQSPTVINIFEYFKVMKWSKKKKRLPFILSPNMFQTKPGYCWFYLDWLFSKESSSDLSPPPPLERWSGHL